MTKGQRFDCREIKLWRVVEETSYNVKQRGLKYQKWGTFPISLTENYIITSYQNLRIN